MPSDTVLYQAAALCLAHPDEALLARLPLVREAAPQLREFTDLAAVAPMPELAAHYTRLFPPDGSGGVPYSHLYLSRWPGDGATGPFADRAPDGTGSLLPYAALYRRHGLELAGVEPPDFLPAVLECVARTGDTGPLTGHRVGLERLRVRLTALGTPYACVVAAVCAALPVGAGKP
ncbi:MULTISPECIES: nitrate reductase molybdenum cofactor assembly chaperone [unclassified Streptomyces]|uniref:nitrate reductase molybdenum cofactor assembly chaperone n=1 Tax=unclassified Streptomyces TaxID=2593676 RepID=UPI0038228FF0